MSFINPAISVSGERRTIERSRDALRHYSLYVFVAILLLAIGWGIVVRFDGLGSRPLVEDEYFSIRGVQYILEKGVPQFPTGGYYMRGLPLQYLQAASVRLLGDNELGHRLPAAFFGVLTLALVFLYARIFLPWPLAATCVAILAVSGWQIEFGRFSRMYAAFQCVTVAFFLAYHRAYFGGNEKLRYLPHALALTAVIFHELGVFLLPFLFLPLLIKKDTSPGATPPPNRWTFAMVSIVTMLAGVAYWQLDSRLRDFHVQQNAPDGFHVPPPDSLGPLGAYAALPITGSVLGGLLITMLVVGLFIIFRNRSKTRQQNRSTVVDVLLLLLLLSAVLHLFAVSACIAAILFIRYQLYCSVLKDRGRLALLTLSGVVACAWVFYAMYDPSWREQMLATKFSRALRIVFFGWPDFYEPIVAAWKISLPFLTVIFLAALAWHSIQQGRQSVTSILRHPIIIILGTFSSIAVIDPIVKPMVKSTRYFYHVYPFVILLIVMACYEAIRGIKGRAIGPKTQMLLSGFVAMGLFIISEDFSLRQLLHINSPEVTFRTGKFKRYAPLWFWRLDDRSPAEFLNAHRNGVDAVVVSIHARTLPYYLHPEMDFAYYCSREGDDAWRYGDIARYKGKLELWTARPLLGSEQELRAYTEHSNSLYLVRLVAPAQHDWDININHVWSDRLVTYERAFLSSDGSTEVVKISLNQVSQKNAASFSGRQTEARVTGQPLVGGYQNKR
jgi:hypothetical protein